MTPPFQDTLSHLHTGEAAIVQDIQLGKHGVSRLTSLGMIPGALVRVVQNIGRGPLIISVRGARIALGRGEADSILISSRLA